MKNRMMLVGLGLGVIACSDGLPTAATLPSQPSHPTLPPEAVAAIQSTLGDAQDRLVPALGNRTLADRMGQALAAALEARDREQFRTALDRAKTLVEIRIAGSAPAASPASEAGDDDAPIVESLELAIELIKSAVLGESSGEGL